jgi:hypothetical protein
MKVKDHRHHPDEREDDMAVNDSRSMNADFHQGVVDRSYIQLTPDRGGEVENPPIERLAWPHYGSAEKYEDHSHLEAAFVQATRPVEHLKAPGGLGTEQRY